MNTFAIATLGCKVNTYESESYVQGLTALDFHEVDFKESADVYIINTCAVTNTAASKSRQKINQAKRNNPNAVICVVGCFIQTSHKPEELGADILIGSSQKAKLPEMIKEVLDGKEVNSLVEDIQHFTQFETLAVDQFQHKTRAFLKIQDGCNQYCSYCIIPFARGRERSMPLTEVIENAKKLVEHGHREIVLTGIHTGRYGHDLGIELIDLLKELVKIDQLERIRISSIEVTELTDELIDFIADNKKIARHLHIPIQSGSDEMLKAMNRPYSIALFEEKVKEIRSKIPNISISSDIIMGFPQESEEQFKETMDTVEKVQFSFLHVFPFSKRDGTRAEKLSGHLSNQIKKERCSAVSFLSKKHYNIYIHSFIGQTVEVLFEYEKDGYYYGHTSEYVLTKVKSKKDITNQVYSVVIDKVEEGSLVGSLGGIS